MKRLLKKSEKSTKTEVTFDEKNGNWAAKKTITEEEVFSTEQEANQWLCSVDVPEPNLDTQDINTLDSPQVSAPSLRERLKQTTSKLNLKNEK